MPPLKNPERHAAAVRSWQRANPDKVRAIGKAWRKANPGYHAAYSAAHHIRNKKKIADRKRIRRLANPSESKERNRNWRKNHPDRSKASVRRWVLNHPEAIKAIRQRRRARVLKAPGKHHTAEERRALFERYLGKCAYCPRRATEIDHVVPLAREGTNEISNCVPACRSCNSSKGTKLLSEWRPEVANSTRG